MDSPYWKGPLPGVDVQRRYLWKTFRGKPNSIPGSARKCSASARNPVRLHPGYAGARHLALEAHVVQLRTHCAEACFYVPQALTISELSEGHGQILVPAREVSEAGVAIVTRDAATKLSIRQEGDQL